jgi:hypothetical protein
MKNIMLFVHPDKDFLPEHQIMIKIQLDNLLNLGWKKEDIILATNFPYEYNGIKSLVVSDYNYCDFCHTFTLVNVILELFNRKIIKDNELYWYHDEDAYQLLGISESELDLGKADMAMVYKGIKEKWDAGSIFFKKSAEDIFRYLREIAYKYEINEEYALIALYTNNLLWITDMECVARTKVVPLYTPAKRMEGRIKTLNLRYMFSADCIDYYNLAIKPLKVVHFTFTDDLYFDSAMYGKNSLKKPLMTERLIKIFQKHGVLGIHPKKMKNLLVYRNSDREDLVKQQIENSLKLGWKKEDIVIIKTVASKAAVSCTIYDLLIQGEIKEGEVWWYHDLDFFQTKPFNASEIDLEGGTAGFLDLGENKFDLKNFFFRKGSNKLFEWIRNRANRLNGNEQLALKSLAETNYRHINSMYIKLKTIPV